MADPQEEIPGISAVLRSNMSVNTNTQKTNYSLVAFFIAGQRKPITVRGPLFLNWNLYICFCCLFKVKPHHCGFSNHSIWESPRLYLLLEIGKPKQARQHRQKHESLAKNRPIIDSEIDFIGCYIKQFIFVRIYSIIFPAFQPARQNKKMMIIGREDNRSFCKTFNWTIRRRCLRCLLLLTRELNSNCKDIKYYTDEDEMNIVILRRVEQQSVLTN